MERSFQDRRDAGRTLAARLGAYARRSDVVVLALPRGGVEVAAEVARALNAPLDILVVRKLGVPWQPELAFGAIASGGVRVVHRYLVRELGLTPEAIAAVTETERAELERRERAFRGENPPLEVVGRTVIVVDDGIATGSTMIAAVRTLNERHPARVVVAAPVAARDTCRWLAGMEGVDEVVCPVQPIELRAISLWYQHFPQLEDGDVQRLLHEAAQVATGSA